MFPQRLQTHAPGQLLQHATQLLRRHPRKLPPTILRDSDHHPRVRPRHLIGHVVRRYLLRHLRLPVGRTQGPFDHSQDVVGRQAHAEAEQRRLRIRQRVDLRRQHRGQLAEGRFDGPAAAVQLRDHQPIGVRLRKVGQDVQLGIAVARRLIQCHRDAPCRQDVPLLIPQLDGLLVHLPRFAPPAVMPLPLRASWSVWACCRMTKKP